MQIIPIASGKGGVGKSLIAANLSIALAQAGKEVIVADCDLGGSNLHIMFGVQGIGQGIGWFIKNPKAPISEIIHDTRYSGVRFIPGDTEIPGLANLTVTEKNRLAAGIKRLSCDFLILDLGGGSGQNVIDLFLSSSRGLVVVVPTLTSVLNAYLFLKNTLFRLLSSVVKRNSPAFKAMNRKDQSWNLLELLNRIKKADRKTYDAYREKAGRFVPRLVLNMLENEKDALYADRVRRSLHEYLGLEIQHLGVVYRDVQQDIALNSRIPLLIYKPNGILSQAVYRIADKILAFPDADAGLLELDTDETFQAAAIEAETDFREKIRSIEELLHSGELSQGDLLDIIRQQYIELSNLKKENQLLKVKLSRAIREGFAP